MADLPSFLLPHKVDVEPYAGTGAYGDIYDAKVIGVQCRVEDVRKLVRSADGNEVISETTLYAQPASAALFKDGSRVQLPSRIATVISCATFDDGDVGAWQHVAVSLT